MTKDLFGLDTSILPKKKPTSEISPIEFNPKKFKQELKEIEENWEAAVHGERQALFDEFSSKADQQGQDVSFIDPHNNTIQYTEYDPNLKLKNVYSLQRDTDQRQRQLLSEWNKFYEKKQRERFSKLSTEMKSTEITKGGINDSNFALLSFVDGITEGASLGILQSDDRIYGKAHRDVYRNANGYGNMIGRLLAFGMLSKAASVMKVPELLAGSKQLQPILKVLGAPKFLAGKLGRLKFGFEAMNDMAKKGLMKVPTKFLTDQALKYGTLEAAGSLGLTNGLIGAFSEGVRNTAKRFQHEDTMKTKEWLKTMPRAMGEGFLQKYFVGVINDPASWSARFLGDGIYSSGQQLYRLATGQQEKWNSAEFWRSFLEGHLLGEIQGAIFKPNRRQLAVMHANNRMLNYAKGLQTKFGGEVNDYWYDANVLWQSELQNIYDKKRFYTTQERDTAVGNYNQQIQNGYTLYKGIKDAEAFDINPATLKKITDATKDKMYSLAKKQFGLTKKQENILREKNAMDDSKVLVDTLKEFNKVQEGTREETPPKDIARALQGIRAMNIDSMMDNVELYLKQYFNKDVDVLDFFARPGEEVKPGRISKPKDTDFSIRKEEAVENVMEWLYQKGGANFLINAMKGTTITDPENLIAQALEGMWKAPSDTFDRLETSPVAYYRGILKNIEAQALKTGGKSIPVKELGEEEDRLAVKEFEAEERGERYANSIYRIYDTYAKKSKSSLKRFLAFYLRSINNSRADVMTKMKAMGIDVETENAVAQLVKNARIDLEKIILGREAERTVAIRGAYTAAEIADIQEKIQRDGVNINRITGARKDMPKHITRAIERDGGYVVSFTSLYKEVMRKFGKDIADKVLWKANQVLQREVDDINAGLADKKAGLEIRNPMESDSTKFIVSMKGMEQLDFRDQIQQIQNVLKQNYNDISEADKKFAVTITRADDTGDVISSFDNVSVSHFRNFKDIYRNTDEFESIKDISRVVNPIANSILNRAFYNSENKSLGKLISKIKSQIDLNPRSDEEWVTVLDTMSKENPAALELLIRDIERVSVVAEIFISRMAPERAVRNEQAKQLREVVDEEQDKVEQQSANINSRSLLDTMVSKDIQDLFFVDIGKGFTKVKAEVSTFRNSLRKFIKEKLTVLEDMERKGEPEQRAIIALNNLADTPTKGDYRTADLVKEIFADFNADVLAGGGAAGDRAMMAFQKLGQIQREEEFKTIFNPETLRVKISPNELTKPIKFKKGTDRIQEDIENLRDRPQDFSQEMVLQAVRASDDPLILSKILVQNYGIREQELLDITGRLEEMWYRPLASWTVKAGDKNFEYFENMKTNLEAGIRQAIRLNVGQISDKGEHTIDKMNFDDEGKINKDDITIYPSFDLTPGKTTLAENQIKIKKGYTYHGSSLLNMDSILKDKTIKARVSDLDDLREAAVSLSEDKSVAGSYGEVIYEFKNLEGVKPAPPGAVQGDVFEGFEVRKYSDIPLENVERVILPISKKENLNSLVNTELKTVDKFGNTQLVKKPIKEVIKEFEKNGLKVDVARGYGEDVELLYRTGQKINEGVSTGGKETIERFIKEIPDVERREHVLKALDWYYELDPDKLSYVHHEVLKNNVQQFNGMIKDFINNKSPRGTKVADPYMSELLSKRKMPTLLSLIEAGYKIDENYVNVLSGTMRYAYTKRLNEKIAQEWKDSYMDGFMRARDAAEIAQNPDVLIKWAEEHSGYFYIPSRSEMGVLKKRLDSVQKRLSVLDDARHPDFIKLQREEVDLENRLSSMEVMRQIFKDPLYKEGLAGAILGTDMFIPGNYDSFVHDRGSKGLDSVYSGVRTQIDDMRSANITNYDGLYFNRVLWKGLRNLVFRNDGLAKNYKYDFQRQIVGVYDKINRILKQIRFYKPTIIMMNDMVQGAMANPAYVKWLPWAFGAARNANEKNPDGTLTERAQFVQDMERMNLDNKSVSFDPLMSESAKAVASILGRPGVLGKMAEQIGLEKNIFKKIAATVRTGWRAQQEVTWGLDKRIRLAVARSMYDRFKAVYDPERAKFMAAEWANMFLVKYSRIPASSRQILNRVGFVLTYRIQTLRMYKEIMRMAGTAVQRIAGKGKDPKIFKASEDEMKQARFEIMPLIRTLVMKGTVKALLFSLLGYGYDNVFDAITSYRAKKRTGEGTFDSEMEFLSLGTPLFDMEKHITRISRAPMVFIKYNMAAFPGLIYSLFTNENLITGKRMVETPWSKNPKKALAELGFEMFTTYFPWAGEVKNFTTQDIALVEGLINFFGLGFYYKYQSPKDLLAQFRKASDKALSPEDHQNELKKFHFAMRRAYKTLFNRDFKDIAKQLEEAREASGSIIRR